MKEIQEFFSNLKSTFPSFDVTDAIDILVVAGLIYYVIKLIWNTSARRIAWAIVILLLATLLTEVLNLHTVNYLLDRVLQLGFVALVIVKTAGASGQQGQRREKPVQSQQYEQPV